MSIERASGLAEAIRKAFVLLDINLPDLDGLEVLRRIMAIPAPPAVVMLTVYLIYNDMGKN